MMWSRDRAESLGDGTGGVVPSDSDSKKEKITSAVYLKVIEEQLLSF